MQPVDHLVQRKNTRNTTGYGHVAFLRTSSVKTLRHHLAATRKSGSEMVLTVNGLYHLRQKRHQKMELQKRLPWPPRIFQPSRHTTLLHLTPMTRCSAPTSLLPLCEPQSALRPNAMAMPSVFSIYSHPSSSPHQPANRRTIKPWTPRRLGNSKRRRAKSLALLLPRKEAG